MIIIFASFFVELCRPSHETLAAQLIDAQNATLGPMLSLPAETSKFFRQRTIELMVTELSSFMETKFAKELEQLLDATLRSPLNSGPVGEQARIALNTILRDREGAVLQALERAIVRYQTSSMTPAHQSGAGVIGAPFSGAQPSQNIGGQQSLSPFVFASSNYLAHPQSQQSSLVPASTSASFAANPQEAAFTQAALQGNVNVIEQLLTAGVNVNCTPDSGKYSALMNAALQGHLACTRYLLSARATVDQQDENGFTALMYAAQHRRFDLVELLVSAGSDLNLVDHAGRSFYNYVTDPQIKLAMEKGLATRRVSSLPQQGPIAYRN